LVYNVSPVGGALRPEADGTTDLVEWVSPDDLRTRPLMPFTAYLLGLSDAPPPAAPSDEPLARPARVQRFGAYAAATDPDGRILLTLIADGFPGAGLWHVAGGGTDHGETPEQALARELYEETSQRGRVTGLLGVSHRYDPGAIGPEGVPIDWHTIRVLFRVQVDEPTEAVVTEGAGSSTAEAAWFTRAEIDKLDLTELARVAADAE
jgi:ADP-ribose pyrophosphatase YjhB (NUDIX family)